MGPHSERAPAGQKILAAERGRQFFFRRHRFLLSGQKKWVASPMWHIGKIP